jgi:ferredoxin
MALKITEECINCDVCAPVCPNEAIYQGEMIFEIKPEQCTECVGHFSEPQCVAICPVDCIILDPDQVESPEQLQEKYQRLVAKHD